MKIIVKNAVCEESSATAYGVFDCEFDFDSHEWSCSNSYNFCPGPQVNAVQCPEQSTRAYTRGEVIDFVEGLQRVWVTVAGVHVGLRGFAVHPSRSEHPSGAVCKPAKGKECYRRLCWGVTGRKSDDFYVSNFASCGMRGHT